MKGLKTAICMGVTVPKGGVFHFWVQQLRGFSFPQVWHRLTEVLSISGQFVAQLSQQTESYCAFTVITKLYCCCGWLFIDHRDGFRATDFMRKRHQVNQGVAY